MRILFLNSVFPGRFRSLAQAFGANPKNTVLFLAETGQKLAIPGVRRLRLAPPIPYDGDDPAEKEAVMRLRRAARTGNALLSLRRNGFVPDLICGAASMGGSFYVRDIFPKAFIVALGDWFYSNGENHCFFTRGTPRPPADFPPPAREQPVGIQCAWRMPFACNHLAVAAGAIPAARCYYRFTISST